MRFSQQKTQQKGTGNHRIYYAGNGYEHEINNTNHTIRIHLGNTAVISFNQREGNSIRYTHRDRLGSARLFTDHNGKVLAQRNYDPFGKPRLASGGNKQPATLSDLASTKTRKGFTDHEHLDEQQLIHMNGRIYDYNLGRFMSVDPFIQSPSNTQSINPYSYIMNNPLAGTDPTGYVGCAASRIKSSCDSTLSQWGGNGKADANFFGNKSKQSTKPKNTGNGSTTSQSNNSNANINTADIGAQKGKAGTNQNGRTVKQTDGTVLKPNKEDGILSVDADGVPTFDESHEDFHDYYLDNSCSKATSGCNIENVRNGLQRYPAPGASGEPVTDEQIGFALPVGYVRHEVSADGGTVLNITLPVDKNGIPRHLLNPGIVRRWVTEDKNNVYIHTYGEGTGPLGRPNEILKHQVWDRVDAQAFQWATGGSQ